MFPSGGKVGGDKKKVGEERIIVGLMVMRKREEQPGQVVRASGWFCTEDTAKVLRH